MSTCLPDDSTVVGRGYPEIPSWRDVADALLHHSIGRLQRLLIARRARRRLHEDLHGLSDHLLRDVDLEVVARRHNPTLHWQGHTPR